MARKREDLTGKRFGMLRVLGHDSERNRWAVRCDCGREKLVQAGHLKAGLTKSCGCQQGRRVDMTGQRFGRLTVLRFAETVGRNTYWVARCDCGADKAVQRSALVTGAVVSCGCFNREKSVTHGQEGSKLYHVWASMLARCTNPAHRAWKNYGGRGIEVCERWHNFENFAADMGAQRGVLDRIDNDGDYEPGNCRWATWSTSNKNQRRHIKEG